MRDWTDQTRSRELRITLWLPSDQGSTVGPGEVLRVRVTVENTSEEPVEYTMWNMGDPPVYVQLVHPYTYDSADGGHSGVPEFMLRAPGDPEIVEPAVNYATIEPGYTIERIVRWDVTLPAAFGPVQAPNGAYSVKAEIFPGRMTEESTPEPYPVGAPILVVGSNDLIDPYRANQSVLSHPSVRRWISGHTGQSVARQEQGGFSVNMGGAWEPITREEHDRVIAGPPYRVTVLLDRREWVVNFASKLGFPPQELIVRVDGGRGQVVSVDPDLEAELKGGVVATFDVQGTFFRLFVTAPDTIEGLFRLQRGESLANIPNGALLPGPGPGLHNVPWSWHLDPEGTHMAEITMELCDGIPGYLERELDYWMDTVQRYCPWSARLIGIDDHR